MFGVYVLKQEAAYGIGLSGLGSDVGSSDLASFDVVGWQGQSTPPAVRRQRWESRRAGKVVAAAEPCIGRAMKCQRATCSHLELDPIPLVRLLKPRPILF